MAKQEYGRLTNQFTLDLHQVQTKEAARLVKTRIAECHRFGIGSIKCVFGSPNRFTGSVAEAILDVAFTDDKVLADLLPAWVYADVIDVSYMPIFLVLPLRISPDVKALTPESSFSGLNASFEPQASLRLLCRMPFQPLRQHYDWLYAARAIGGCSESKLKEYCSATGMAIQDQVRRSLS